MNYKESATFLVEEALEEASILLESKESHKFLDFKETDYSKLAKWLKDLKVGFSKAPRGMKKEFENLQFLKRQVESPFAPHQSTTDNIRATFSRMSKQDIDKIEDKLLNKKEANLILKLKNAEFFNESIMSEKNFVDNSKKIDKMLSSLKGVHKKALTISPLKIRFVRKDKSKSTAVYKTGLDEIYIRTDRRKISGEGYGSVLYIIVHELGHRYEDKVKTVKQLHNIFTTPYSKTDTLSGSEAFAELFAISHFGTNLYPEHEDKINLFNLVVK